MTSPPQRELSSGEKIDTFIIKRTLGVGGFGITYLALDTSLNIEVAIKEYFPQNAWRDENSREIHCYSGEAGQNFQVGLQRFYKEGQILAQFKHPNIVRVRQMLSTNSTAYLVMDYEHGEELEAYLCRLGRSLSYQEAESIINPMLDGLRAVHDRGLLHLDIKPENIFLRKDSTPILIDFGGARHHLGQASRTVSFLVASDGYAPNEQYTGNQLQPTTDIYAVGATLYRCITRQVPADAQKRGVALIDCSSDPLTPIQQTNAKGQYPLHFLQTIEDALSMRVSNRPQSIRELQQRLFQGNTAPVKKEEPKHQPAKAVRKTSTNKSWTPILLAIPSILVILFIVVFFTKTDQTNLLLSISDIPLGNVTTEINTQQKEVSTNEETFQEQQKQEKLQHKISELAKREAELKQHEQRIKEEELAKREAELERKQKEIEEEEKQIKKQLATPQADQLIQDETSILSLVEKYAMVASQNNVMKQLRFYTEPVDYYSKKGAYHDFIISDATSYIKHYPERKFNIQSPPKIELLSKDNAIVQFRMSHKLLRAKDEKTLTGTNLMKMKLRKSGDSWKISSVYSKKD